MVGMSLVAQIAPEVDRLVWAMAPATSEPDRELLREVREQAGLDNLGFLPNFAEFFLGPGVTAELARTRMRYVAPGDITDWLGSLESAGLVSRSGDSWTATHDGRVLVTTLRSVQERTATALWGDHPAAVTVVNNAAALVIAGASDEHVVAVAHRALDAPTDPCLALFHRMVTMRYLRQHDHAAAWLDAGLIAKEMTVLTELWHGGVVEESAALDSLVDKGLATADCELTGTGQQLRDSIEEDTNRRNAEDIAVLGDADVETFLVALKTLPPD
jgi:Helix-turn-helix family